MCTDYKTKKDSCKKRMIDFNFTKEEYAIFCKLQETVKCAYTNQAFIFTENHKFSPTLERIAQNKPYSPDNCVWVTAFANNVKERYIESNKPEEKADVAEARAITRIKRILASEANLVKIKAPYVAALKKLSKVEHNNDIDIASGYCNLGRHVEKNNKPFLLTFSQYKTLINKKYCGLTGRHLSEDVKDKSIYIIDKSKSVDKDNTCVTSKELRVSLDKLTEDNNLTVEELRTMFKVHNEF